MPSLTDADGRQISWTAAGTAGAPPLIVQHAGMTRGAAWAEVLAALERDWHAVAIDLPAHGATDPPAGSDPQAAAMADAARVQAAVFDNAPAHYVGHSFGATAALHRAVQTPARVSRLTLFEPVYFVLAHDAGDPAFAAYADDWAPIGAAAAAGYWHAATAAFLALWNGGRLDDLTPERQARRMAQMAQVVASAPQIAIPTRRAGCALTKWRR